MAAGRSIGGRLAVLAVLALLVALSAAASAGFVSGRNFLRAFAPQGPDTISQLNVIECRGYAIDIADTLDCYKQVPGFNWDSRNGTSQSGLVNIVIRWFSHHPQQHGFQANGLLTAALVERFPCR